MHARERPAHELEALFADGWPAFIGADVLAARHVPAVRSRFAELELALLRHGVLVAACWGVPVRWDGTPADLPGGYSDALARAVGDQDRGTVPDTLVICAAQIRPDAGGTGLAAAVLGGLVDTARAAGLQRAVAPLRPTAKHRYPLIPIEAYASWTRADGSAFDPWLRTHLRMGARVIGTAPASQTFTGSIAQWEGWSGSELPGDGDFVVPGALSPLHVDRGADLGRCVEPAIWVQHR